MEHFVSANLKLGIIAGGQLGKMLIQQASQWDIITYVLDREADCPAGKIASQYVQGDHLNYDDVMNFGRQVDVLTFELENINIQALKDLKAEGKTILPDPSILELIQDKGRQKNFYRDHDIPTSDYILAVSAADIRSRIDAGEIQFPFVQKLRTGGYDGRGVAVIDTADDLEKLLDGPSVIEPKVDIVTEIAIIAVRNGHGDIRCFPAVEMVFDPVANLVERLVCPSSISEKLAKEAESIAIRLIDQLKMSGLLAVEFFVDTDGNLLVNESAPRPHNSGHHTIESVITSQFEQHLRCVLDLPLGSTHLKMPAVMLNLLGEPGFDGPVKYEGFTDSLAIEGVNIHVYGKKFTRPMRKMGHVTVMATDLDTAQARADMVQQQIKVKAWDNNASAS